MNSPNDATKTPSPNPDLREHLARIGLASVAAQLDDMLAHASKQRWSPRQLLEQLAQIEAAERAHRSLERRLRASEIKRFKPMADFEWSWPTRIERDVIERAMTLDFLAEARNLVLVGANGLGKTMIAQNICHAAALLLGSLRRLIRPADAPRLAPIRSLAYFRPVIEELQENPAPENYRDYLRLKLRKAAETMPADGR